MKSIAWNAPPDISLDYDVDKYKLAGSLTTLVLSFATLSATHCSLSDEVVLMPLLGSLATFVGLCSAPSPALSCRTSWRTKWAPGST